MRLHFGDWFYGEENDIFENASNEKLPKEYLRYFVSRTKPYKKFRPFKDPNNYTPKKRKFLQGKNKEYKSFFTILNELNFDDDEIRKQLYKYNNAFSKYRHFKYKHNLVHKPSYFSSISSKIKHAYINNSLNSVCNLYMPSINYLKDRNIYKRDKSLPILSLKKQTKKNLRDTYFAIYLNNHNINKRVMIDNNEWIQENSKSKELRRNDRELFFFKIHNKLLKRRKNLILESSRRFLYKKRLKALTFDYRNTKHLTDQQVREMVKLLRSPNLMTRGFFYPKKFAKVLNSSKTHFEVGKALLGYLRSKVNKKRKREFFKKKGWGKLQLKSVEKIKSINFNLTDFFTSDYVFRKNIKPKKKIDIHLHRKNLNEKTLLMLYKSFDSIFLPELIYYKFTNKR